MDNDRVRTKTEAQSLSGVVAWREARLHLAGFDEETASQLASDEAIDFHALLDLVDHGCPAPLAARILAPLCHEKGSS